MRPALRPRPVTAARTRRCRRTASVPSCVEHRERGRALRVEVVEAPSRTSPPPRGERDAVAADVDRGDRAREAGAAAATTPAALGRRRQFDRRTGGICATPRTSTRPASGAATRAMTRPFAATSTATCVPSRTHVGDRHVSRHRDAQRPRQLGVDVRVLDPRQLLDPARDRAVSTNEQRRAVSTRPRRRTCSGSTCCAPLHPHVVDVEQRRLRRAGTRSDATTVRTTTQQRDAQPAPSGLALHLDTALTDARIDRAGGRQPSVLTSVSRRTEPDEAQLGLEMHAGACLDERAAPRARARARPPAAAPGSATKKFACFSETTAPPMRSPLQPAASMSRPAASPGGFVNTDPAFWPPGWCSRRQRTISSMRVAASRRVVGVAREGRGQHHRPRPERRPPVAEARARHGDLVQRRRRRGRTTRAWSRTSVGVGAVAPGVHADRAAHRAGDARRRTRGRRAPPRSLAGRAPGAQPRRPRRRGPPGRRRRAARTSPPSVTATPVEAGVGHEQVRASTDDEHLHVGAAERARRRRRGRRRRRRARARERPAAPIRGERRRDGASRRHPPGSAASSASTSASTFTSSTSRRRARCRPSW